MTVPAILQRVLDQDAADEIARILQDVDLLLQPMDSDENTLFHHAIANDKPAVAFRLASSCRRYPRLLEAVNSYGETPFYVACRHARLPIVVELLATPSLSATCKTPALDGTNAFWAACRSTGSADVNLQRGVINLLLSNFDAGFRNVCRQGDNVPAFAVACLAGNPRIVQDLLRAEHQIDFVRRDAAGKSPVDYAREQRKPVIVRLLVDEARADPARLTMFGGVMADYEYLEGSGVLVAGLPGINPELDASRLTQSKQDPNKGSFGVVFTGWLRNEQNANGSERRVAVKGFGLSALGLERDQNGTIRFQTENLQEQRQVLLKARSDFEREVRLLQAVGHPNVVELVGYIWPQPRDQYLLTQLEDARMVFERADMDMWKFLYVGGLRSTQHSLTLYNEYGPHFLADIADDLAHLHENFIIHGDLKVRAELSSGSDSC